LIGQVTGSKFHRRVFGFSGRGMAGERHYRTNNHTAPVRTDNIGKSILMMSFTRIVCYIAAIIIVTALSQLLTVAASFNSTCHLPLPTIIIPANMCACTVHNASWKLCACNLLANMSKHQNPWGHFFVSMACGDKHWNQTTAIKHSKKSPP
jgi:hypothetical protein